MRSVPGRLRRGGGRSAAPVAAGCARAGCCKLQQSWHPGQRGFCVHVPPRCWDHCCRWYHPAACERTPQKKLAARSSPLPPPCTDSVADLPAEVLDMLAAGRWTATAVRWTVAAADALRTSAHPPDGPAAAEAPQTPPAAAASATAASEPAAVHDLQHALLLVKAAVASLALVSDVGFEAALRHLSKEYFAVAAKASGHPCLGLAHGVMAAGLWGLSSWDNWKA